MTFVHTNERLYKIRRIIHCDTVTSQHIYDVIDNNRKSEVNDLSFRRKTSSNIFHNTSTSVAFYCKFLEQFEPASAAFLRSLQSSAKVRLQGK